MTTLKGPEAGAYYVDALPGYYLDEGEPAGRWLGSAVERLGLAGAVVDEEFLAVMAGTDPRSGGLLGRDFGQAGVRGLDVTCSAPKSVSVLFAVGDERARAEVLASHDAAVGAMVGWIDRHVLTRRRVDGQVAVVDADGVVAAAFRQHTSRALDPQLHTHVVVANRVPTGDGRWLALDARGLKVDQHTLSALYHAGLRAELTARLGVAWREVGSGLAEIDGVPEEVLEEFSARTEDITRRVEVKLDRFVESFGRDPSPRERWRLQREAVLDSRPAKARGLDAESLHADWSARLGGIGLDPAALVDAALHRAGAPGVVHHDAVIDAALAGLVERQSTWRPAELVREVAAALPPGAAASAVEAVGLAEDLAGRATGEFCVDLSRPVPAGVVVRRDGRPVSESVLDRALTVAAVWRQEATLLAWAERRTRTPGEPNLDAPGWAMALLDDAQARVAAAVAGTGGLVVAVGPAGTGKTTALAAAVSQLEAEGRGVFGVAPSATAAGVLAEATGMEADTVDKLLAEHEPGRRPAGRYRLAPGSTIICDEAAMVSTPNLARLAALADDRG